MGYFNFENNITPINDTNLNAMQRELMKMMFPVGSRYITENANTNPSTILEFGTWERFKGLIALGVDEDDTNMNTIGKTGGEKEHTLTVNEIPSHTHPLTPKNNSATGLYELKATNATGENGSALTGATGGGQAHNNMQPFEIVGYMWIRRS